MEDDNLSMNRMVEMAMGLSMASLFVDATNQTHANNRPMRTNQQMAEPPRYIHVIVDGEQRGPLSVGEIANLIGEGRITLDTLMWKPGMANWMPAREINDIGLSFSCTPPSPPEKR